MLIYVLGVVPGVSDAYLFHASRVIMYVFVPNGTQIMLFSAAVVFVLVFPSFIVVGMRASVAATGLMFSVDPCC
jgi:hypothetical protein